VFVRTVLVWHITWSVNSVTHLWGYRNYETGESSRNNLIIGFLSHGEGWHNNHHADPSSARYGHCWWELDVTWQTIRLLAALGLARGIKIPSTSYRSEPSRELIVDSWCTPSTTYGGRGSLESQNRELRGKPVWP
jgi:fatty-acid desaturase